MEIFKLVGNKRESFGSNNARVYRNNELIPCVVYGGKEVQNFTVKPLDVRDLVYSPKFRTVQLDLEGGKSINAILKSVQYHPVTDKILHIDFQELIEGRAVKVSVPVEFVGKSKGVQDGGSLIPVLRKLKIKATPENLVDHVDADITELELGFSIKIRDLSVGEGVELLHNESEPVAYVETPRSLKSLEASKDMSQDDDDSEEGEDSEEQGSADSE